LYPLVAGLTADIESLAEFQEAFSPLLPALDELDLFYLGAYILPRHCFPPHGCFLHPLGKCHSCARFIPTLTFPTRGGRGLFAGMTVGDVPYLTKGTNRPRTMVKNEEPSRIAPMTSSVREGPTNPSVN
jgi:hypothetical protein